MENEKTAVIVPIHNEWVDLILSGQKKFEIRKTWPRRLEEPFPVYLYETRKNGGIGAVVAEWICDKVFTVIAYATILGRKACYLHETAILKAAGLSDDAAEAYAKGKDLFGWHISELKIYDDPVPLSAFGLNCPPQSWRYVRKLK